MCSKKLKNQLGLRLEQLHETVGNYLAQCPAQGNPTNANLILDKLLLPGSPKKMGERVLVLSTPQPQGRKTDAGRADGLGPKVGRGPI